MCFVCGDAEGQVRLLKKCLPCPEDADGNAEQELRPLAMRSPDSGEEDHGVVRVRPLHRVQRFALAKQPTAPQMIRHATMNCKEALHSAQHGGVSVPAARRLSTCS